MTESSKTNCSTFKGLQTFKQMLPSLHFKCIKWDIILHYCNDPGAGAAEISPTYESPKLRHLCAINDVISLTDCVVVGHQRL